MARLMGLLPCSPNNYVAPNMGIWLCILRKDQIIWWYLLLPPSHLHPSLPQGYLASRFPILPMCVIFLAHCSQLVPYSSLSRMTPRPLVFHGTLFHAMLLTLGPVVLNQWHVRPVAALFPWTRWIMFSLHPPSDTQPPMMGFVPPPHVW
jgi:hypothetical protein